MKNKLFFTALSLASLISSPVFASEGKCGDQGDTQGILVKVSEMNVTVSFKNLTENMKKEISGKKVISGKATCVGAKYCFVLTEDHKWHTFREDKIMKNTEPNLMVVNSNPRVFVKRGDDHIVVNTLNPSFELPIRLQRESITMSPGIMGTLNTSNIKLVTEEKVAGKVQSQNISFAQPKQKFSMTCLIDKEIAVKSEMKNSQSSSSKVKALN